MGHIFLREDASELQYLTENERFQAFRQRKNRIVLRDSDDLWYV